MACGDKVFTTVNLPRNGNPNQGTGIISERKMDQTPADLFEQSGLDCTTIHDVLLSYQLPPGNFNYPTVLYPRPVRDGSEIELPSFSNLSLDVALSFENDIVVFRITQDGVEIGDIGWRWIDGDTVEYNTLAGGNWPAVMGVNCDQITWQMILSPGGTGGITITQPVDLLSDYDYEAWWCCTTVAYNCCGGPIGTPGPRFLIPRPPTLEPGEENISTPPIATPLSLSNHTFQFHSDYGRNK